MADRLTHAGGVVTRIKNGRTEILLVRAKRPPHDWVLPKGQIEKGERPDETARREVREEAGVDAELVRPLGRIEYELDAVPVRVAFFHLRFVTRVPAAENRDIRWCSRGEARVLVGYDDVRRLIAKAFEPWPERTG